MQVLEDMLLTLQELFMLPSVRLRPMLSIPPMEWVILDMLDTLVMVLLILELFMLPNVKKRLLLMLNTMHMDMEAMVLDTDSILMDMATILDTLPLAMVVVLDTDMVMDSTDKQESQKNNSLTL